MKDLTVVSAFRAISKMMMGSVKKRIDALIPVAMLTATGTVSAYKRGQLLAVNVTKASVMMALTNVDVALIHFSVTQMSVINDANG